MRNTQAMTPAVGSSPSDRSSSGVLQKDLPPDEGDHYQSQPALDTHRARQRIPEARGRERKPPPGEKVPTDVLIASLCCSVGTTWTVVLRKPDENGRPGRAVVWISCGVPITEPAPGALAHELLAEHGFAVLVDDGPAHGTRSARHLGFASRSEDLIRLAKALQVTRSDPPDRAITLAARWLAAGYDPDEAIRFITADNLTPIHELEPCTGPLLDGPCATALRAARQEISPSDKSLRPARR